MFGPFVIFIELKKSELGDEGWDGAPFQLRLPFLERYGDSSDGGFAIVQAKGGGHAKESGTLLVDIGINHIDAIRKKWFGFDINAPPPLEAIPKMLVSALKEELKLRKYSAVGTKVILSKRLEYARNQPSMDSMDNGQIINELKLRSLDITGSLQVQHNRLAEIRSGAHAAILAKRASETPRAVPPELTGLLSFDGERGVLDAMAPGEPTRKRCKENGINAVKLSAKRSGKEQAADANKNGHRGAQSRMNHGTLEGLPIDPRIKDNMESLWAEITSRGGKNAGLSRAKKTTLLQFVNKVPHMLSQSFRPKGAIAAWELVGWDNPEQAWRQNEFVELCVYTHIHDNVV